MLNKQELAYYISRKHKQPTQRRYPHSTDVFLYKTLNQVKRSIAGCEQNQSASYCLKHLQVECFQLDHKLILF